MSAPVRIDLLDHVCVAHLAGEIDLAEADPIQSAVLAAFDDERMLGVVLDLSEVTFLDSAGIRMLFGLHGALSARGRSLVLVVPPGATFRRVLDITHVPDALATAETVEAAVDLLQSRR